MKTRTRIPALDLEVDDLGEADIHSLVDSACECHLRPKVVLAMNPEKLSLINRYPALTALYRDADVILPDGVGVRVAARLIANQRVRRMTGADLMHDLAAYAAERDYSIALIGADEATNASAAQILCARFPGLRVAFRHHGYFADADIDRLLQDLTAARPNILFIGLGSPRQELFVARHRDRIAANVIQCVGGTFDTITGKVKRAPLLFQRAGCEWLYRVLRQPTRLPRYGRLVKFSARVMREALRRQPLPASRA
jgi:N-acetylglucosaminyldiphosphoundecaprenol N-acetyl-beta-D-mannosaminyltransferase